MPDGEEVHVQRCCIDWLLSMAGALQQDGHGDPEAEGFQACTVIIHMNLMLHSSCLMEMSATTFYIKKGGRLQMQCKEYVMSKYVLIGS